MAAASVPALTESMGDGVEVVSKETGAGTPRDSDTGLLLAELRAFRAEILERLDSLDNRDKMFTDELKSLQSKFSHLETRVDSEVTNMKSQTEQLAYLIDKKEQQDRYDNILISGLPLKPNENVTNIILQLASLLSVEINKEDIEWAYRVKRSNNYATAAAATAQQPIVVKLRRHLHKVALIQAYKKNSKDRQVTSTLLGYSGPTYKIIISDHLTATGRKLLTTTKEKAKAMNYLYVWVHNSKVLCRKDANSKVIVINSFSDLVKIT